MSTTTFPFPVTLTPTSATVYINHRPASINRSSSTWDALVELIKTGGDEVTAEQVLALVSPAQYLKKALAGTSEITVEAGAVWYAGEQVNDVLADIILDVVGAGLDPSTWVNFANKVFANPSSAAREELYEWLVKAKMPIAPDGDFYAYKYITSDYKDCYSRSFDNSVGAVVEMPRGSVDPNRERHCSSGLHFCSLDYLKGGWGGNRVVLVKINPADVVSIPSDYSFTKGRTCRYEVVDELTYDYDALAQIDWAPVVDVVVEPEVAPEGLPRKAKKAAKKASKGTTAPAPAKVGTKAPQRVTVVESPVAGRITRTKFKELVREHGTLSGIAKHYGISSGTVQAWKKKLGV